MQTRLAIVEPPHGTEARPKDVMQPGDSEHSFFQGDAIHAPATPAGMPDPTRPDPWSDEERAALARRRLGPSDWVLLGSFVCAALAVVVTASAARGPMVNPDVERPRVREAVIDHVLQRASSFADPDELAVCLSLFGSIDPLAVTLRRFDDRPFPVVPLSRCLRDAPELAGRRAYSLSVGKMQWLYGGYVQVLVGDERRDLYTLKRRDDGWQVVRIEPAWR